MARYERLENGVVYVVVDEPEEIQKKPMTLWSFLTETPEKKGLLVLTVLLGLLLLFHVADHMTLQEYSTKPDLNIAVEEFLQNNLSFSGGINRETLVATWWDPESEGYHFVE